MSLLAYNKTTAPLALAAGAPIVTLPASPSTGARGPAVNVTSELKGLSSADFALLQAQVAAGQADYEWTTLPEFGTFSLVVGSAAGEFAENTQLIYVGDWSLLGGGVGNDGNPGTLAAPLATLAKAESVRPTVGEAPVIIKLAPQTFLAPLQWYMGMFKGPASAPPVYQGTMLDQLGAQAAAAGTTAKQVISSSAPVFRSGAIASISAITGAGQTKTMTVTGMTGLTAADVNKNFWFALATNKSTNNTATTSVTWGAPAVTGAQTISGLTGGIFAATSVGNYVKLAGAANATNNGVFRITAFVSATSVTVFNPTGVAEGPTAAVVWGEQGLQSHETGNNGMFKMAAFISATSATFYNAQALVENTAAIYWQDCFRGDWLHFTTGAAALINVGGLCITDHGERARATVDLTGVPVAGDTLVINDGTNPAVTFTWRAVPAVANEVLIGGTAAASLTNLIAVINQNNPNSGATPLRVRMYNETATRGRLVNMLTGSVGNTASPTKTGVWTPTIVTFATAAAGVGAPTTTFTLQGTGFGANVPAVGNSFVVEKIGTTIQYANNTQILGKWPLFVNTRLQAATVGANLTTNSTEISGYQFEVDANGGGVNLFKLSNFGVAVYTAQYANLVGVLPVGTSGFPAIYCKNGAFTMNGMSQSFAIWIMDHSTLSLQGCSLAGGNNTDTRRTTLSPALRSELGSFANNSRCLATLLTADLAIINGLFAASINFLPVTATPCEISYSSGYGIRSGANIPCRFAAVGGVGNALAGFLFDLASGQNQIDINGNTTTLTGQRGDTEFAQENVPNVVPYATIRTADANGIKLYPTGTDPTRVAYGNRCTA